MADTFANARLLTVFGYEHVLGQQTSIFASNWISGYFVNAALPPPGTLYRQDRAPFATGPNS